MLPSDEHFFMKYAAKNRHQLIERLKALKALRSGQPAIVIAPVSAAIKKIPPHASYEQNSIRLTLGEAMSISMT